MEIKESLHPVEAKTRESQPELGKSDVSGCLPGWIKTFCEQFETEEGLELSRSAVNALGHTLIAARARQERLVRERDEAIEENDRLRELFQRWITEWEATWTDPDEINHEWAEIYQEAKKLVKPE